MGKRENKGMKKIRITIGDIFEIPLSGGRKAYGQYVYHDKKTGPLICVFDSTAYNELYQQDNLLLSESLFPPIFTGLFAAIRTGLWKIIGHSEINSFHYPNFVSAVYSSETGKVKMWYLWDGNEFVKIGPVLPQQYQSLEYLIVWAPQDIAKRIEIGYYPFPYREMIEYNQFTPQ